MKIVLPAPGEPQHRVHLALRDADLHATVVHKVHVSDHVVVLDDGHVP